MWREVLRVCWLTHMVIDLPIFRSIDPSSKSGGILIADVVSWRYEQAKQKMLGSC
jgi:hypothetical protein